MEYNKLVRDKIPEIIRKDRKTPITHIANDREYWIRLKLKLIEETDEFLKEETLKELTDILEVIEAICNFKEIDKNELLKLKKERAEKRGKFKDRIVLERVE